MTSRWRRFVDSQKPVDKDGNKISFSEFFLPEFFGPEPTTPQEAEKRRKDKNAVLGGFCAGMVVGLPLALLHQQGQGARGMRGYDLSPGSGSDPTGQLAQQQAYRQQQQLIQAIRGW